MQIINKYPPVYEKIIAAGLKPNNRTVFTYGDAIYNPHNLEIPEYLERHEEVHVTQQGNDPDAWWDKYLKDPSFRHDQEAEAYKIQYDFMCQNIKDRNQRARLLMEIAKILSGPIYGQGLTIAEAMFMIKSK